MGRFEERITKVNARTEELADSVGSALVNGFHLLALFAIGGAIVWSASFAFIDMVRAGTASVEDILLLFIYLELGAMVGIYFKTNRMPVRFLIYVAITALTRFLIGFVNEVHKPDEGILVVVGGILLLSLAALALRYGSYKLPSDRPEADPDDGATPAQAG